MHTSIIVCRLCGLATDLATDPEVQVRFLAVPHFLRSSGSETGCTQPHEYKAEITAIVEPLH
jgi:hypothetical protein